ncbi:MAG: Unknown protein [uncultured Aureispira sp.]|uniref:Galanin n=1 Tax=uncultured Aureispira sp. TaxID=1331704 RepID=A0A6S6S7I6_9BACT|nr:MAG: Unknown protein [uncultured Aureispira sp.]
MKTLNDIRRQIDPCLQKNEAERQATLEEISKAKQLYLIPTLFLLLGLLSLSSGVFPLIGLLFFCAMVGFFIIDRFKVAPYRTNYRLNFKKKTFSTFIEALYPGIYYAPGNYVPSCLFDKSELFGSYDNYSGEDYFEGKTENGCSFKFSELSVTSTETTTDSEGHSDSTTTTVFSGLLFVLNRENRVQGRIQVLPDTAESNFGKVGKFFQKNIGAFFKGSSMVYMEGHPEFEKEFVVYSKHKEEVHRVLSPNLLQAIYDLRYKWKTRLSISFIGHEMYVALPTNKDFFDPDIQRSVLEDKLLQELYNELALCFSVVEDLSLEQQPNKGVGAKRSNAKDNPFLL